MVFQGKYIGVCFNFSKSFGLHINGCYLHTKGSISTETKQNFATTETKVYTTEGSIPFLI